MNTTFWDQNEVNPLLNLRNCQALSGMYGLQPLNVIRSSLPGVFDGTEYAGFHALDSVVPPTAWFYLNGVLAVFCGGTSGMIHVPELFEGWRNVYENWEQQRGASGAFYHAGQVFIDSITPEVIASCNKFYLFGHSYGGACLQAFAARLISQTQPQIKIWSYGSPRPGLFRLGTVLQSVKNTRFFADNDPVRFIPPHSTEVPGLTALDDWELVQGCNRQVQVPKGYELQADGKIVQTEGNPTVLHAVAVSITRWCMDDSGFRSVNHALANYINRFSGSVNSTIPVVDNSGTTIREREEVLTVRQRDTVIEQGLIDVNNALVPQTNFNTEYLVPALPAESPLRYRRRRVGRVWGVKLGEEVVAIGPGKRQALRIARAFNRAAKAHW